MKKILILTNDFKPKLSVGSHRINSWYKFLPQNDVMCDVITIKENIKNNREIIEDNQQKIYYRASNNIIKKYKIFNTPIISGIQILFQFFSRYFDEKISIYDEAENLLKNEHDYGLIIASGEPFILFKYAHKLSKKFNIPWLADYRDGWTTNYELPYRGLIYGFFNKWVLRHLERKYTNTATLISTVSEPLMSDLKRIIPNKKIVLVRNGYSKFQTIQETDKKTFSIAYAGTIYSFQKIDVFMKGFEKFQKLHSNDAKLYFYGLNDLPFGEKKPHQFLDKINSENIIYTDLMPYPEVMMKLSYSNILLVLSSDKIDGSCKKIYDYLSLKRTILVCVNDNGSLERIINHTNSGVLCKDSEDVYQAILSEYLIFQGKKGGERTFDNIEFYCDSNQVKTLANFIKKI